MKEENKVKLEFEEKIKNPQYYKHSSHATYNLT